MNLVKTLAKVAMGVMVARGVGKMMGGNSNAGSSSSGGGLGGLGGLLGGGSNTSSQSGSGAGIGGADGVGGLSQGNTQRGNSPAQSQTSGGLGSLLEGLTGGGLQTGSAAGGLAGILGSVLGGKSNQGGGLGGLLESLGGGARSSQAQQGSNQTHQTSRSANAGSLGDMLNQAFGGEVAEPEPDQNAQAELMLRGMLNAAKSDGKFDEAEQQKLMKQLGDVSPEELAFVQQELAQPLDVDAFVRSVPKGLEQQVYVMSLLGIELDSRAEAQYLDSLARGLGISQAQANAIHQQVGVPNLYG